MDEIEKHKIEILEKRVNDHSPRIDRLEQSDARKDIQIENLCKNIQDLTSSIKWVVGLISSSFIGFFFYVIQNNLFK